MLTENDLMKNAQAFYAEHGFIIIAAYYQINLGTVFGTDKQVDLACPGGSTRRGRSAFPVRVVARSTREEAIEYTRIVGFAGAALDPALQYFYRVEVLD